MKDSEKPFYQRLTHLFRSGPSLRRKVTGQDTKAYYDKSVVQTNLGYYGGNGYKRESSPFSVLGSYGLIDRIARYCLAGDMKVLTSKGACSMEELAELFLNGRGKDFYTMALNLELAKDLDYDLKLDPKAKIIDAFFTKEDEIIEVSLSNGAVIRCTKDITSSLFCRFIACL